MNVIDIVTGRPLTQDDIQWRLRFDHDRERLDETIFGLNKPRDELIDLSGLDNA